MSAALTPAHVLARMADALPARTPGDVSSDISSSYEALGLFSHACMIAVGFRLTGYSEEGQNEQAFAARAPRLDERWNAAFGSHSFVYSHPQLAVTALVKIDRMGGKAEIRGVVLGADDIARCEVTARDYVASTALPLRMDLSSSGDEDRATLPGKLGVLFVSESRLSALISIFYKSILLPLFPAIAHDLPELDTQRIDDIAAHLSSQRADQRPPPPLNPPTHDPLPPAPAHPYPFHDPLAAAPPHRPMPTGDFPPPGFDDELDLQRGPRNPGPLLPDGRSPFNIGHDDLYPPGLGPHDPLRPTFGGGGAPGPSGMYPSFHDPLFGGRGDARNPRAPPGARYDPVGPGDGPQGGRAGRPPNPFGNFGPDDII